MLGKLKQKFVSWLLKGVHLDEIHIGEHSVVISGTGANMDGQKIENVGAPDSDDDVPRRVFSDLTGRWTLAQAHRGADGKIMVFKGPAADPVEEDKPAGDMAKATYDPDADGVIALAQLDTAVCSETEADGKITTHKGDASAHHAKTGNYEVYPNTEEVTSLPSADAAHLGRIYRVRSGAGVKTTVYMCVQNDADGYEYIQIGIST